MTGWDVLTTDDVLNQFNNSEVAAYDAAKGDANSAALGDIITKVTAQIVQAYADGGRVTDTNIGTIPDGEKNRAIAIVRYNYLVALPTGKSLAENRKEEAQAAEKYFMIIAKREIKFGGAAIARPGRTVDTCDFDSLGQT